MMAQYVERAVNINKFKINRVSNLTNKEIEAVMMSGNVIEGIIIEKNGDNLVVAVNGDRNNRMLININNALNVNISEYPYYSFRHKRNLREQKRPRFEFRFTREELNELVGKYVSINYDGKVIEGEVVKYIFREGKCPNEIIVKSKDEEKSIHDYRIRKIEITGENSAQHEGFKKMRSLEEELFELSQDKFNDYDYEDLDYRGVEPNQLLEEYFYTRMRGLKDKNVDLSRFDYNWVQEVVNYHKDKSNRKADEHVLNEIKKARNVNNYYNQRKEFIDFIFEKVRSVNWKSYCKNQLEAEIEALEYIYESGIVVN